METVLAEQQNCDTILEITVELKAQNGSRGPKLDA